MVDFRNGFQMIIEVGLKGRPTTLMLSIKLPTSKWDDRNSKVQECTQVSMYKGERIKH